VFGEHGYMEGSIEPTAIGDANFGSVDENIRDFSSFALRSLVIQI
jgi:hypothetical protein